MSSDPLHLGTDAYTDMAGHCLMCECAAVVTHPMMSPALWEGTPAAANIIKLCDHHAILLLSGQLTRQELIAKAPLLSPVLPPQLYPTMNYDHWGNLILNDNRRARGELFHMPNTQQALLASDALSMFTPWVKFPRTFLLPWVENPSDGDRTLASVLHLEGHRVVVTEKMDGENITLYRDYYHSRSIEHSHHPSRLWLKTFWENIATHIPVGWRLCGEYLFTRHALHYNNLPSYFLGFCIWDEYDVCLDWDQTQALFAAWGVHPVAVIYEGIFDRQSIHHHWLTACETSSEGYIVRRSDKIEFRDYKNRCGKFIRADYSQVNPYVSDNNTPHQPGNLLKPIA